MDSALRLLLKSEDGENILRFLRDRGPRAHIIAPQWLRELARKGAPEAREKQASWSVDAESRTGSMSAKANTIVVAENADEERAIVEVVKRERPKRVYGLFARVLPALLCSGNGMVGGQPVRPLKRYAILCVPRSGSRYLSSILSNRGIGAPKEHLRTPLADIIATGNLGFGNAIAALERFGQKNQIFGTKLISTFLIRASRRRMPELNRNFAWLIKRNYQVTLLERPLGETVISSYIAFLMQKWHFFGEMNEAARATLDNLEFEDGAAWSEFIRFRTEKIIINAMIRNFSLSIVRYTEIEADVDAVVRDLCRGIDVDPESLPPASSTQVPVATRTESPTYARFAERLGTLSERRRADIEPYTVKKLRSLTAVNQKDAERLVAEHHDDAPACLE